MKAEEDEVPEEVCERCGGSGIVPAYRVEDYVVEDSSPREVSMEACPLCGGAS